MKRRDMYGLGMRWVVNSVKVCVWDESVSGGKTCLNGRTTLSALCQHNNSSQPINVQTASDVLLAVQSQSSAQGESAAVK